MEMGSELSDPKDKSILIVEDDESMREFLEMALKKEGFRVATAASGDQALGQVAKSEPDLILLDLMLPGRGGYEVLGQLRQDGVRVLVVVMTARRMDRKTVEMMRQESGVAEFLEKPLKAQVLTGIMHRLLKTRPMLEGRA